MHQLTFLVITALILCGACGNPKLVKSSPLGDYEVEGVSFVGMPYENKAEQLRDLTTKGMNWLSQMPFAFQRNGEATIHFKYDKKWWGESTKGIALTAQYAKQEALKTLLKPQIWMGGEYTGKMELKSADDWAIWEQNYATFIHYYARLADSLKLEAFCIGTELQPAIMQRTGYWLELIDSIRTFYTGKLTYAANWDEYKQVPFWNKLDWIGINAYFPLSQSQTPTVNTLLRSWKKIIPTIKQFSDSLAVPVVFTEIGYKSVDSCAWEPWNPRSKQVNQKAQANAYEAFFRAFGEETSWFKGSFLWKWYPDAKQTDGRWATDYTPQNKQAEKLLK